MGALSVFPYREEGNPPTLRPTVDVRLQHGANGDWSCRALLDTGAPISFFDRGVADALGIRIRPAGAELDFITVLGGRWQIQWEHADLSITGDEPITWSARVGFVLDQGLQMPFQGVLGTKGFLDQFAVTFNAYYDYFAVGRADDFEEWQSSK